MLAYLLYFQFPFVYLLALTMGLVVYGSDFDGISGWLYVLPLILYAVIHKRRRQIGVDCWSRDRISGLCSTAYALLGRAFH
jgi:hypothetical protein